MSRSRRRVSLAVATLGCVAAVGLASLRPAHAQLAGEEDVDIERIVEAVAELIAKAAEMTGDRVFEFLETVELFDAEAEIDRLAGNPRELNDSTAYKLSLLPFHIRYPIYKQLVRQMTRQDDLRSRRIYNVSPGSVSLIALRLESLTDDNVKGEVRRSLLTHFNARELIDLGFFVLAQQPFFPDTEEGWQELKRRIADGGAAVALSALALGAAFDVGALTRSGSILKLRGGDLRLGWYAGFRRLGFSWRPLVRGGLTLRVPGVEAAAGIGHQVRPDGDDVHQHLEFALREGWLSRVTSPLGWDAFFEAAVKRVLNAGLEYQDVKTAARFGFFAKRDHVPHFRNVSFRGSAEMDYHFGGLMHMAVGAGFQHGPTGLAIVAQGSRTPATSLVDGERRADTRGGIFFAGTMEPPTESFIERMRNGARLARDEWDAAQVMEKRRAQWELRLGLLGTAKLPPKDARVAVGELERCLATRETHLARLAERLADYLESRRVAYAISQWNRRDDDLHGPLDAAVLRQAVERVIGKLNELAVELAKTPARLERMHDRYFSVLEAIRGLEEHNDGSAALPGYREELVAVERVWQGESVHAKARLDAYMHYRENVRRMIAASRRPVWSREVTPVRPDVLRRVIALQTFTVQ